MSPGPIGVALRWWAAWHFIMKLGCSVQEWGKRHGIIKINAVITFHSKFWAAFGCQMTSAEYHLEVIWKPKAGQNLLWNLIIAALILRIPCRLRHSCTERPNSSYPSLSLLEPATGRRCTPFLTTQPLSSGVIQTIQILGIIYLPMCSIWSLVSP